MKTSHETMAGALALPRGSAIQRFCRNLLLRRLSRVRTGEIILHEGGERTVLGQVDEAGLRGEITVHDPRFYQEVARGGSIGAAESYVLGHWSSGDLTTLMRILARDRAASEGMEKGLARLGRVGQRIRHALRPNTRKGSRRNISSHYDLGNEFFATFLDPTLTYSCGVFAGEKDSMLDASTRKYDLICRKLELGPESEVLEIGSGWGGFAIHAARHYGCRVVTTTISRRQHERALERVRQEGLQDRVEILLEDYRDLPARLSRRFDRLVSIEMIEAVGDRYLDDYFRVCASMLRPRGRMLLQAIVIEDRHYDSYRRSVDFIRRHIFPGGCLPSITAMCQSMTRTGDLGLLHLQDITAHYPRTLRHWCETFLGKAERLEEMGFDERFRRLWEFYFRYCEAGFLERSIGVVQMLVGRAGASVPEPVPQR